MTLPSNDQIPKSQPPYGPNLFASDLTGPPPWQSTNEPLPLGAAGGIIESVKRAVVGGLRDSLVGGATDDSNQPLYVDLEYALKPTQYPGVWVQFSITDLRRMGLAHEVVVLNTTTGDWDLIQEWQFTGRITLTIAALTSIDRDRLADQVIAQLAFARTPDPIIVKPGRNNDRYRALIRALDTNPYVSMTLNTDALIPSGQTVTQGVPWQQDVLLYEDGYSIDCFGQFNVRFSDGVYSLAALQAAPTAVSPWGETSPGSFPVFAQDDVDLQGIFGQPAPGTVDGIEAPDASPAPRIASVVSLRNDEIASSPADVGAIQ